MRIREWDAGAADDVAGWLAVEAAALAADVPDLPLAGRDELVGSVAVPWPGDADWRVVAEVDEGIVGTLLVTMPQLDNPQLAELELIVTPEYRRRGIGTALHEAAVARVRDAGRTRVMAESVRGLPDGPHRLGAGSAFAPTVGAKLGQTEVRRRLDVSTVDANRLPGQIGDLAVRAAGYSVVSWSGTAPDEVVVGLAELDSRFIDEAPLGDLRLEAQNVDVARIRDRERGVRARGRRRYEVAARHDATGEIVAWSAIDVLATGSHADQGITLVLPEHRGHSLGMLTKLVNLRQLLAAEPELVAVDTWNAEVNARMIAINERLGFHAVDAWDGWQREL